MTSPQVRLDPSVSLGSVEKLREPLQDQLTSALQVAVDTIDEHYHGQSVDDVSRDLLATTKDGLHQDIADAFAPDQAQLRVVAESIVAENS